MLHKISLSVLLLIQTLFIGKLFSQEIEITYPFMDQVFSDLVQIEWGEVDESSDLKLFVSTQADFSNMDSVGLENRTSFEYFPDSSFNSKYYFFLRATVDSQFVYSDTSSFLFFNPKNVAGLKLWVSSDYGVDTLNSLVYGWQDKSGYSNDLSMTNVAKQPTFVTNGLNDYPNVFFDAVNDGMSSTLTIDSSDYLMTVLYSCMDSTSAIRRTIHGSNNWLVGKYTSHYNIFAGAFTGGKPFVRNAFVLQTAKFTGDTLKNYLNSIKYGQVKPTKFPGLLGLGSWSGSNTSHGYINEWLVYDTTISDSLRLLIEKYVMDKYAPPVNLGADIKTCGFPITISAEKNYVNSYLWSDNSTQSSMLIPSPGLYWLRTTDIFGRTFSDTLRVSLDTFNTMVKLPSDTVLCVGEVLELNAGPEHYTYSWNIGSNLSGITVDSSGMYAVSRTNCLSLVSSDTILVQFNLPSFSLGADTSICFNNSLSLQADSNFTTSVTYLWNTGNSSPFIQVDSSSQYSLQVIDAFGCSYSDTINVNLDSSLFNVDLGTDTSLCEGNKIGLVQPNSLIVSYLWSTNSVDSTIAINGSGTYYLTVNSANCSYTDSLKVDIKGLAPTADFHFSNSCFGDSVQFIDSSMSLDQSNIISWEWDFGNGQSSSLRNPIIAFDSVGQKNIVLIVATDSSCSASVQKQLQVFPKPLANFTHGLACENMQVVFSDSSSISEGTIVSHYWDFDGMDTDSSTNSYFSFPDHGQYTIDMVVESSRGCKDTISKILEVNPAPEAAISSISSCFGDSTHFFSNSSIASGANIKYEWNFGNGTNLQSENASTFYYQSGQYIVFLKITSDQSCSALFRDTIDIKKLPIAGIGNTDFCEGESLTMLSTSSAINDSLIYFQYVFNNQDTSYVKNPVFPAQEAGGYNMQLLVRSLAGCEDTTQQTIQVHNNPVADFAILNQFFAVPLNFRVENRSIGATSYLWDFGNGDRDTSKVPEYSFADTGSYMIELKSYNVFGCEDSASRLLYVEPFFLDASIEGLTITDNGGFMNVLGKISNTGANAIQQLKVEISLSNGMKFIEYLEEQILPGATIELGMKNNLYLEDSPNYACMEILELNHVSDARTDNNKMCVAGPKNEFTVDLSPNPVSNVLQLKLVLPSEGDLKLELFSASGSKKLKIADGKFSAGYHAMEIDMQNLSTGSYILRGFFEEQNITQKIIKY